MTRRSLFDQDLIRRVGLPATAAIVITLLTGCAGAPTEMPTPDIIWDRGLAPSSALEREPVVQAARESSIGLAMAENTGDFTISQLTNRWHHRHIEKLARMYASQETDVWVYPGPEPWEPVRIVEQQSDYAILEVCETKDGPDSWRLWGEKNYGKPFIPDEGELRWYEFAKVDGYWKRLTGGEYQHEWPGPCDHRTVPIGYFNPRPKLPETPVTAPVRAPLPLDPDSEENEDR